MATRGKLFVDIGACYGRLSLLLHKNYEQIWAIEPEPQNVKTIIGNITYGHARNVRVIPIAVSDKIGFVGMRSFSRSDVFKFVPDNCDADVMVATTTLADLLADKCADLVKVDVEGAEWQVLNGAASVLNNVKKWVVELHDLTRKVELEHWFLAHGYKFFWLDDSHIFAK